MRDEPVARAGPSPWLAVFGAAFALGLVYLGIFAVPPLITVFVDDLGLSHAESGALMSVCIAAMALVSPFSGALADRFGPLPVMAAALVLCGAAMVAFALTTSLAVFLVCRAAIGVASGLAYAPGLSLAAAVLPARQVNVGVGVYLSGLSAGGTVAFVSSPLLEAALDWRWPFRLFGVAAVAGAGVVFAISRSVSPRRARTARAATGGGLRTLARSRPFVLLCAGLFVSLFVAYGVLTWIPPYLDESAGFSTGQVSLAAMLLMLAGIPATLLSGWVADRTGRPLAVAAVGIAGTLTLAVLATSAGASFALAVVVGVVASFGVGVAVVPLYALPAVIAGPAAAATAAAVASAVAMVGGIASTYVGGWLIGATDGYGVAFWVYTAAAAVTVIVLVPLLGLSLRRTTAPGSA